MKQMVKAALAKTGFAIVRTEHLIQGRRVPSDMEPEFLELWASCKPYTMTSIERMYAAYRSAIYVAEGRVQGAIVECGVWKGGSTMMMLHALKSRGVLDREIYLYDTFEGMPEPTEKDRNLVGDSALSLWRERKRESGSSWCFSPLAEVEENIARTGYPLDRVHFIKGKVEDTIPGAMPEEIAVLRLDTDWFESTYHELVHLFPRLTRSGVLILDDYGHWHGAREATDQYFREQGVGILLQRIDYSGRIGVKI